MPTKVHKIAILPGDGIGPEVTDATIMVLDAVQKTGLVQLEYLKGDAGFDAIKKYGTNLPDKTIEMMRRTSACLKGPMTTPEEPGTPRSAAVTMRALFNLYANVRPARTLPNVTALKPGIDMIVVRENTEGLYSGKEFEVTPGVAVAMKIITRKASERIAKFALELAMKRRKKLAFVHKANILKITDGLFKQSVLDIAKDYPQVELEDLHIDAAAMQLIRRPESFDVIVTMNLYGDILSDEAAATVGGLGVAAGANIGENYGMFEPIGGGAPEDKGPNKKKTPSMIEGGKKNICYFSGTNAGEVVGEDNHPRLQ